MSASDLIAELIPDLNLPRLDDEGRQINWHLLHQRTDKPLDESTTLIGNGVRASDHLLLSRSISAAGSPKFAEIVVRDWPEFFPALKMARESLGNPDPVWYRGQASAAFTLLPSLYRAPGGSKHERSVFQKFRQLSGKFIQEGESDWDVLFAMQHYGVPTRLLDWTPVAGIAVFFALSFRAEDDKDCAVFLIDPVSLNKYSGRKAVLSPDEKGLSYTEIYWENRPFAPKYPLAMEGRFRNDRMSAQRGVFTVHSVEPEPLEQLCPACIRKLRITPKCAEGAREFLSYANINDATMFPDIQGLANYLRSLLYLGRLTL
jgi:hypothetical protein